MRLSLLWLMGYVIRSSTLTGGPCWEEKDKKQSRGPQNQGVFHAQIKITGPTLESRRGTSVHRRKSGNMANHITQLGSAWSYSLWVYHLQDECNARWERAWFNTWDGKAWTGYIIHIIYICADVLGISHISSSRIYTEYRYTKQNKSDERKVAGWNTLLISDIRRESPNWTELKGSL